MVADALSLLGRWLRLEGIYFRDRVALQDIAVSGPSHEASAPLRAADGLAEHEAQAAAACDAALREQLADDVEQLLETGSFPPDGASDGFADDRFRLLAEARGRTISQGDMPDPPGADVPDDMPDDAGGRWWPQNPPGVVRGIIWPQRVCKPHRRLFWEAASACFHPSALLQPSPLRGRVNALGVVFAVLQPLLFEFRPCDCEHYRHPPPEMFERIALVEFCQQYERLVTQLVPQLRDAQSEGLLYKGLMSLPYERVHDLQVWHVLRAYHRVVMAGGTTEALAESVCSSLTAQVRGCSGRRRLGDILNGVKLRSAGVSGSLHDQDFIKRAMDIYFRGEKWHVHVGARALMNRRAAEPSQPDWLSPAVRSAAAAAHSTAHWQFLAEGLRTMARHSARADLSKERDAGAGSAEALRELVRNPKAGVVLRQCSSRLLQAQHLRSMVDAMDADVLDDRMEVIVKSRFPAHPQ